MLKMPGNEFSNEGAECCTRHDRSNHHTPQVQGGALDWQSDAAFTAIDLAIVPNLGQPEWERPSGTSPERRIWETSVKRTGNPR